MKTRKDGGFILTIFRVMIRFSNNMHHYKAVVILVSADISILKCRKCDSLYGGMSPIGQESEFLCVYSGLVICLGCSFFDNHSK